MICNKCGREFGSGIKCQYCGIDRVEGLAFSGNKDAETLGVKTNIIETNNTCPQSVCFQCGEIIPASSTFCPFCGKQQIIECPKCKYRYPAKFPICSNCGTNREEFLNGYIDMPPKQATCVTEVNEYGNATTEEKIDGLFCHQKKYNTGKKEDWYEYRGKRLPTERASYDYFYPLYGPIASRKYYLIFIPQSWSNGTFYYGYILDLEHYETFQVPISYTHKGGGVDRNKRLDLNTISKWLSADYKGENQLYSKGYLYYIYTYTYDKKGYRIIDNIAAIHHNGIDFYTCTMKKKSMLDSILYCADVDITITLARSFICTNNGRPSFK